MDKEKNVPTWYSSFILLICSILIATIAFAKKSSGARYARHWTALSIIFLYLSVDESACIHEISIKPLRSLFNASGIFHFPWVIPGAVLVLIFILVYLKFFLNLPAKTRILFLIAGIIYIGGAIGMEMIDGLYYDLYGKNNIMYGMLTTFEEFLEMTGLIVFIYALISYMNTNLKELQIHFYE